MTPSKKKIQEHLGLSSKEATKLKRHLADADNSWGRERADRVDATLDLANRLMDAYGVEAVRGDWVDRYYQDINTLYVNTGDTYNATLLYDTVKERFYLTTLGDWVEMVERQGREIP